MKRPIVVLVVVAGLILSSAAAFARAPSGAVFTTTGDGTEVNANIFQYQWDVFLDGGPGPNAPADAAALPAGDYVFQVTDPSGTTLLSSDPPECRVFNVDASGLITGVGDPGGCGHATGYDVDHGAATVQLWPFDQTPNFGEVYKVWVTPLQQFDPANGGHYGFSSSDSKTDVFKVLYPGGSPNPD
ncbi:MAG: hypothetical protein ABR978_05675 [Dehalococcoidia bacterium]|jgi:hypothetical protein